jgi:hypothetical protein
MRHYWQTLQRDRDRGRHDARSRRDTPRGGKGKQEKSDADAARRSQKVLRRRQGFLLVSEKIALRRPITRPSASPHVRPSLALGLALGVANPTQKERRGGSHDANWPPAPTAAGPRSLLSGGPKTHPASHRQALELASRCGRDSRRFTADDDFQCHGHDRGTFASHLLRRRYSWSPPGCSWPTIRVIPGGGASLLRRAGWTGNFPVALGRGVRFWRHLFALPRGKSDRRCGHHGRPTVPIDQPR